MKLNAKHSLLYSLFNAPFPTPAPALLLLLLSSGSMTALPISVCVNSTRAVNIFSWVSWAR